MSIDYARIGRAIEEHNFAWAQQELEKHLGASPQDYRAHLLLGIVYDESDQAGKAVQEFQKSRELRPREPAPHINLGKSYARRGKPDLAAQEFRLALRVDPHSAAASTNLGLVLAGQKKYAEALAAFQKAIALNPRDPSFWLNMFDTQLALKKFSEARVSARKIIELASPSAELYNRLGAMQAESGDYAGAIQNLEKAQALDPHLERVRYNLGLACYRAGNQACALQTLGSLHQDHDTAEVENLLGEVYEKGKEYLEAVRAFQKAAEMEPANESYRFDFIQELLVHHNFDAAILIAEPALGDFPDSQRLYLARGVAYFGRGRFAESLDSFLEAAKKFPDAELPLYFLAMAADATGKTLEETKALLEAYLRQHPEQFWPYYFLGRAAYRPDPSGAGTGDLDRAERLMRESIKLNPNYADSHYELGVIHSEQKRWAEAIKEYRKAIQLQPSLSEAHYRLSQAYRRAGNARRAEEEMKIHGSLKQHEAEETLRLRQVNVFLYRLR